MPCYSQVKAERDRKRRYSVTPEDFLKMMVLQDGRCAICDRTFGEVGGARVDHCHASSVVRGLLCHHCNAGLGLFRDNVESLKSAVSYLNRSASNEKSKQKRSGNRSSKIDKPTETVGVRSKGRK